MNEAKLAQKIQKVIDEELRPKYWWEPIVSSITYWGGLAIVFLILIGIGNALAKIILNLFR